MTQNKEQRSKNKAHLSAIILAAGQSKRMGKLKPLLPFGEKTVIESCIDSFNQASVDLIVVVLGHQANSIQERLSSLAVQFAFNPQAESEMSESIACGVRALPADWAATFITPADHPAVPASVIITLADEWRGGEAKLLIPEYAGRGGHPVLVDLCFREELLNLDPGRGLRGLFDEHRGLIRRIPVDSPFVARDLDTWDDYRALHEEVFGTTPPEQI